MSIGFQHKQRPGCNQLCTWRVPGWLRAIDLRGGGGVGDNLVVDGGNGGCAGGPVDRSREQAEEEAAQRAGGDGQRNGHAAGCLDLLPGGFQVHRDDDSQVIIGAHGGVQDADDGEQDEQTTLFRACREGGGEDLELAPEPGQGRNSREAEKADRQRQGRQRAGDAQPRQVSTVSTLRSVVRRAMMTPNAPSVISA